MKHFKFNLKEIPFVLKVLSLLFILMVGSVSRNTRENKDASLHQKSGKDSFELAKFRKQVLKPYFQDLKKN